MTVGLSLGRSLLCYLYSWQLRRHSPVRYANMCAISVFHTGYDVFMWATFMMVIM